MVKQATLGDLNVDLRLSVQRGVLKTALRILHHAWPAANRDDRISIASTEDEITNVLRREMIRAKRSWTPPPKFRIERESQSDVVDDGSPLGLIDIQIGYSYEEVNYIAIECKRIESSRNTLAHKYVREGVNRFVTCKYSGGHAFAGMVGYVICGDRDKCVKRVQSQMSKEKASVTGFDVNAGWTESLAWVPSEVLYESHHRQTPSGHRICLVHSYLKVS